MLARLVSATQEPVAVISLGGVSDHYRTMSANREALYLAEDSLSMTALPAAIARISRFIRRERPRAVVCWMYHAMLAGTLAAAVAGLRTPVVWTVRQSLDDPASLSRSTRAALNVTKRLSRWTTGIIYNSSRAKQLHEAYGYASHNSAVIANGFDIPEPATYEPLLPPVLGAAGRLHPQKDFGSFFRAAALTSLLHPEARYVAAGEGLTHSNPDIRQMLAAAGLDPSLIDLRGDVDFMAPFYQGIYGFVLASRTEGFPNVVAEAMSFGKPVISTDVGDSATVVGETGLIVPPRDPEALARAMCQLLELPRDRYVSLATAARERIRQEYALPAIAAKYLAFVSS